MIERKSLLGVRIDRIDCSLEEAVASLSGKANQLILTLDVYQLLKVRRNKKLKEIINNAALVIPASPTMANAYKFINKNHIFYKKDILFFSNILSFAERKKMSLFLFGDEEKYFFTITEKLKKIYPRVHILGSYQRIKDTSIMDKAFEGFKKIDPNLFVIYMDFKKAILWFNKNKDKLNNQFFMPVKKPIDAFAGKIKIPELSIIEANREKWFYLRRNLFNAFRVFVYICFWILVITEKLSSKKETPK